MPPPPPLPPDLLITSHAFATFASQTVLTIQNAGLGPAGPFLVTTNDGLSTATVDSLAQIAETYETNNMSSFARIC